MESTHRSIILTPADFADTGQWRLIIYVSSTGMGAVLRHVTDASRPAVQLFDDRWENCGGKELLDKIENAVYDHPSLLDDYATEIVVCPDGITWVPTEMADEEMASDDEILSLLHVGSAPADVMMENVGEETALYGFTDGFDSFMARTIPGARMRCDISVVLERVRPLAGSTGLTLFLISDLGSDMLIALNDGRLAAATTISSLSDGDIASLITQCIEAWGKDGEPVKIYVGGSAYKDEGLLGRIASAGYEAEILTLPDQVMMSGLPLAAALLVFKKETETIA